MKALTAVIVLSALVLATDGRATEESNALFSHGVNALNEGKPAAAIADFEALADQGVVDASASYNRGAAYAMRVRIGGEQTGDLGRAAHGFEEARTLTGDPTLDRDAKTALGVVRAEIARRRARAGEPVDIDPGVPALRAIAGWLDEDTWLALAAAASVLLTVCLLVRWRAEAARARVASLFSAVVAFAILSSAALLQVRARADRLGFREAVVVASGARPCDERGIAISGATPLPEAARVSVLDPQNGSVCRVRFGAIETRVPSGTLRAIASVE